MGIARVCLNLGVAPRSPAHGTRYDVEGRCLCYSTIGATDIEYPGLHPLVLTWSTWTFFPPHYGHRLDLTHLGCEHVSRF